MKKIIIILMLMLLTTGCSSTKETNKASTSNVNASNETATPSCH